MDCPDAALQTQGNKWLKNDIKWVILGAFGALFLAIGNSYLIINEWLMKLPFKMLKKRPKIIIFCKCPDQTMDLINMLLPVTDRRSTMCRFYILNTNTSLSLCLLLWHQCWSEDLTVNNCLIEGKQHKRRIWDKNKSRCFCMRLVAGYCTIRFSFFFFLRAWWSYFMISVIFCAPIMLL